MRNEERLSRKERRKLERDAKRRPKYWVTVGAMGALVAYGAFDTRIVTPVYGKTRDEAAVAKTQRRTDGPAYRFDIPPGPLADALDSFRATTGWTVALAEPGLETLDSPGVKGFFPAEEALLRLLDGTGVGYRFTGPEKLLLEVAGPSSSLTVTDARAVVSSPKYTAPLRDTPQTVTVITSDVIEEQAATTLRDVLRNVPGLTLAAGEGGSPAGDNLTLRGFSARNDVFVDGVRDLSPQARDPFNLEQVEVVKGPASAFSGRGSAGGTINLVSKSPTLRTFADFDANVGTDRTKRVTADVNVPLSGLGWGDGATFRINAVAHESGVAGRDIVENQRWGVAPSLAFGLGTSTRLTLGYFKLDQRNISDYGIPWVPANHNVLVEYRDRPAPVARDTFYGFAGRDFEKLTSDVATIKFEHDFSDRFSLRNQFRYGNSTRDSIATPPRFASPDSTVINREMRSWLTEDDIWDNQTDVTARFSTGAVEHSLVGGLALTRETNERRTRTAANEQTTLFNPNPYDLFSGDITTGDQVGDVTGRSAAAYLFDTVSLNRYFQVSGGLRYDYFDAEGVDLVGNDVDRIDRMLTGRLGVVFKPRENGSIYAAYGSSLSPSLEGLSYGIADQRVDPEETYTFEVGTKWDLLGGRLATHLAGFRVDKTNARTPSLDPGGPPQVLDGRQRVVGAEVSLSGNITREWSVFGGYTFLDSKILESNTGIAPSPFPTLPDEGHSLQNTPKHSASIWTTYQLPWRIDVGGAVRFVDERFGNNANTRRVDSYWTADLTASYALTENVDVRLNVYNLNDAYYFDRLGGGHLIPGPGRSANLSFGFKF